MIDDANEERGEIDLVLDGQRFVLRPSYVAMVAMEKKCGRPLIELATLAEQGLLTQEAQAIVVTELIRAWGAWDHAGRICVGRGQGYGNRGQGVER